jgi:hypothetical protein
MFLSRYLKGKALIKRTQRMRVIIKIKKNYMMWGRGAGNNPSKNAKR